MRFYGVRHAPVPDVVIGAESRRRPKPPRRTPGPGLPTGATLGREGWTVVWLDLDADRFQHDSPKVLGCNTSKTIEIARVWGRPMKDMGFISERGRLARHALPYKLIKIDHPTLKHVYLPVNRDSKPLGMVTRAGDDWVDYADYDHQFVVFNQDPANFKGVWFSEDQPLVLYNDGHASRQDYFQRLERLFSLGKLMIDPARRGQ